jgi:hypothetical protein
MMRWTAHTRLPVRLLGASGAPQVSGSTTAVMAEICWSRERPETTEADIRAAQMRSFKSISTTSEANQRRRGPHFWPVPSA